jgi:putative flippase GtrA
MFEQSKPGKLVIIGLIGFCIGILITTFWTKYFAQENIFGMAACGHIGILISYLVWGIQNNQITSQRQV